jgi:GalNAc-alpha-(1->4)-GalNAc-alpha-(1->3)-diNAcBac-PP-undecaprenol alpha-1,4-N-acetyl-D-galactosaminyltransferase
MSHNIALVIHALRTGGAEKVLVRLAEYWAAQGHSVTLITLDDPANDEIVVTDAVRRVGLDALRPARSLWQGLMNNVIRLKRLRRAIRATAAPVVISFTDKMNVLTLLACVGLSVRVVIAERSDPVQQRMSRAWEFLRRRTYPRCHMLVVQTTAVATKLQRLVRRRPIEVIANAVARPAFVRVANAPPHVPACLIAAGRLSREKGFDLLIAAFAQIADQHRDWRLKILGEGPQHGELSSLIAQHRLENQILLAGRVDQPQRDFATADLFVLPSRYEGFPNALLEAMASGLPAVAFDCDSGPREIIRPGIDGLLVPAGDVAALAGALHRLMSDARERARLARQAVEVVTRFDETAFLGRWDDVLARTACK